MPQAKGYYFWYDMPKTLHLSLHIISIQTHKISKKYKKKFGTNLSQHFLVVIARLWDRSRSLCHIFSQAGQHQDLLLSQHLEPSGRRGSAVCALGAGPTSAPSLGPLVSCHISVQRRAGLHYERPSCHYGKCLAQEAPVGDTIPAAIQGPLQTPRGQRMLWQEGAAGFECGRNSRNSAGMAWSINCHP